MKVILNSCGNVSAIENDYLMLLLSGNPSATQHRNAAKHNRAKSSIYENHGNIEAQTQKPCNTDLHGQNG